jgi:cell division protein FtsB
MSNFKKNRYRFWHSPFVLIILFGFLVFFGYKIIDLVAKERETSLKKELILSQINTLKEREKNLLKNTLKLETEEGKEEVIREKYQVSKEGEKIIIIVDEENNESEVIENENHGFVNWIKKIFKR